METTHDSKLLQQSIRAESQPIPGQIVCHLLDLQQQGHGNIPSFTAINNGTAPIIATIIVTPHFSNGGVTCDGPAKTFTITVNPTGEADQPVSQVICNGATTTTVTFTTINTGGVTTYSWTNDQPTIGLAASGLGNIPSFTATKQAHHR